MKCIDCIHFEVCRYVDPNLPVCDSFMHKDCVLKLPCPLGTNLYRIDSRKISCHRNMRDRDEYYCQEVLHCYCDEHACDCSKEYYIFNMENADAMTILGNEKYFGTRVFTSREEAEKKLEEIK